jgi:hypothetical protein
VARAEPATALAGAGADSVKPLELPGWYKRSIEL